MIHDSEVLFVGIRRRVGSCGHIRKKQYLNSHSDVGNIYGDGGMDGCKNPLSEQYVSVADFSFLELVIHSDGKN